MESIVLFAIDTISDTVRSTLLSTVQGVEQYEEEWDVSGGQMWEQNVCGWKTFGIFDSSEKTIETDGGNRR